jgi:hypothetical protein
MKARPDMRVILLASRAPGLISRNAASRWRRIIAP